MFYGLAILDSEGQILGEPPDLRVGEFCMKDLQSFYKNKIIARPAVHKENKKREHFDVIQNIDDNGETVGTLFASAEKFKQNVLLEKKIPVPDSDWILRVEIEQPDQSHIWMVILIANMLIFVAVSISVYLFVQKIHTTFKTDFTLITQLLTSVKNKHELPDNIKPAICVETQELVSSVAAIAEEITYYQKELLNKSNTDELTGLPNRRFFQVYAEKQIAQAERNNDKLTLLYIDLDGFKQVNDTSGHAAGDQVLQIMAERFKGFLRKNELMARLGGDEFCLLIYGDIDKFEIKHLIKRLESECMEPVVIDGVSITLGMSVGMALYPNDGISYDELIACADKRMYKNKKSKQIKN